MAYKKSYRKITKYRGGYRLTTPNRMGNMIGSAARFAWKNRGAIAKKAEELFPGITGSLSGLGAEAMRHGLAKIGPSGKPFGLPLIPQNTVPSVSQGEVSITKYVARHKCPSNTLAIKKVLSMAQRLELSYVTGYRLTNGTDSTQLVADMSRCGLQSAAITNVPLSSIYGIGTGGYISSTNTTVNGIFHVMAHNIHAGVSTARSQTTKMFLTSCDVDTEIANVASYPLVVDIYEVMAKEDCLGGGTAYTHGPYGINVYSPVEFWSSGLNINTSPIVGSAIGPTNTTSKPYDNALFNSYWRICSKVSISLSTGDVHRHQSRYQYNKVIDMARANYSSIMRNITRNIMIVVRGTTVQDSAAVSPPLVVTGASSINVSHRVHYKYMAMPYSSSVDAYFTLNKAATAPYKTLDNGWTVDSTLNPL